MRTIQPAAAVLFTSLLGIFSCGGGGSESNNPATMDSIESNGQNAVFMPPNDAGTLEEALYTRYTSDSDFDVWLCSQGSSTPVIAYALPAAGTLGEGLVGNVYFLAFGGESRFSWQTLSGTRLQTTSLSNSVVSLSDDYRFTNVNRLSFVDNDERFDCSRVSNSIAFGGETDNDNITVTADLEAENFRIPNTNRPTSAVSFATFDPIFGNNLIEMVMTFPNGLTTSCVDWDLVNQQPRDCGSNFDVGGGSPLRPLAAGQTIDGAFRTTPNQLVLTSSGEITLGSGVSSFVHGIGSTPDLRGTYYINGFTITMEFDGNTHHTFIGVQSESNGQVQSLLFANRFFDRN